MQNRNLAAIYFYLDFILFKFKFTRSSFNELKQKNHEPGPDTSERITLYH